MKTVVVPIGKERVDLRVPRDAEVLSLKKEEVLPDLSEKIRESLNQPIGAKPLAELSLGCDSACVVVSDNTRPVPYKGSEGILQPIVETLKASKVRKICILIACGTHRPMTEKEIREMLGDTAFEEGIETVNHSATDGSALRCIGSTRRTPNVTVNRHYLDAEIKIVTGLVEPHFMAGFSGGRKAVCPGICGQEVTYGFHSASILADPNATSLNLEANPCHEEAVEIAKMAGVDFMVNVTINSGKQVTGVFAGDIEKAHRAAVEHLGSHVSIRLEKQYDVVVTQAGDVGVNHYQCAKAAVEASRAVKRGGKILLLGNLTDPDPVGGENYKQMLQQLADSGHREFIEKIQSPDWIFIPEQWQVQMWSGVFEKLGNPKNLISCMPQLEDLEAGSIPETNAAALVKRLPDEGNLAYLQRMAEYVLAAETTGHPAPDVLLLPDGPYAVPLTI